ncbi:FecR domain-containing protein [Variovorax sp. ZS18.2.2]|uniref:FecR family protein n=1 Tax=Variovorax sp. ZS18.2.2 TaxID=2971255 RepID=UPI0021513547|nr:FecR domain-containing protein [Variovorax sp. ZS18.2.2]MCR6480724.1 FecR domain-containing protein [Variovorax sp. ZS18.2.2]
MSKPPTPPADASRTREEALDWFVRRRSEGFSPQEEEAFQTWLAADVTHREAFDRWHGEWHAFDDIPQETRNLLQRSLAYDKAMDATSPAGAGLAAAELRRPPVETRTTPSRRSILIPVGVMAVVAAVMTGSSLFAWNHWQARPVFTQALATQRGQQMEVPMPDGTRLRLDTATRLEVAYYRQRREVRLLEGQAAFSVQRNPERPFHVFAGPVRITVVGTRFFVRHTPSMPGDDGVHIAVEEGKVQVGHAAGDAGVSGVILSPGQQVSSNTQGVLSAVSPVSSAGAAPWREHRVSFDNLRLDRALAELARYRDLQLVIRDPTVAALQITGVFDPRDMATFRRVLPASLPVRLKEAGGGTAEVVLAR